ncbi:protein boule-like isoform X3 [Tachysurus fulvidraco]|uniref:protein boule-like isoform X3 n=1 Tax=Tachysurus fulvidraco TaxID=1234273 RepID=UPI001FEF031E|nr:protein boule-like isoform X3 [Tachysurus fulvidraco]
MLYFAFKRRTTSSLLEMESETGTQTSSPSVSPAPPELTGALDHASHCGTVIPNRIFVGGLDLKTNENDLRRFFSGYGTVKEVKIVTDHAGLSKGYGFVTFETAEDAQKILHDASADKLCFRDKRLNIGQAIRKQVAMHSGGYNVASPNPPVALPAPFGTVHLTTPTGYPYTYHNGVAYFHNPEPNIHPSLWPASHTAPGSPVMVAHSTPPFYTPQTCPQHQSSSQYMNGHVPWAFPQSSVPVNLNPLLYVQPAELMYHPVEPIENGCVRSAVPLMEAGVPEAYMDHLVQQPYQVCLQRPMILPHSDGVKEQKFQPVRRGFSHSAIHTRPRYCRGPRYTHLRKEYRPDLRTSPPPASSPTQDALK